MLLFETATEIDFNTADKILNRIKKDVGTVSLKELMSYDIRKYMDKLISKSNINITDQQKDRFYNCIFSGSSSDITNFIKDYVKKVFNIGETLYDSVYSRLLDLYGEEVGGNNMPTFGDILDGKASTKKMINKETFKIQPDAFRNHIYDSINEFSETVKTECDKMIDLVKHRLYRNINTCSEDLGLDTTFDNTQIDEIVDDYKVKIVYNRINNKKTQIENVVDSIIKSELKGEGDLVRKDEVFVAASSSAASSSRTSTPTTKTISHHNEESRKSIKILASGITGIILAVIAFMITFVVKALTKISIKSLINPIKIKQNITTIIKSKKSTVIKIISLVSYIISIITFAFSAVYLGISIYRLTTKLYSKYIK